MVLVLNQSTKKSFNPFNTTINFFSKTLNTFNNICYRIFQFGNIIMFLIFFFMALHLFLAARETEYKEKIHARNIEYIKKRGRIGITLCVSFAVGFLGKGFPILILWCLSPLPTPIVFNWLNLGYLYKPNTSLYDIYSQEPLEACLLFSICIISLLSSIMIILSIYLIFFSVRVVDSNLKTYNLLVGGIVLAIVFGVTPGFWLLH